MNKIRILQSIILLITILLISYTVWMYNFEQSSSKLDEVINNTDLSRFNIVLRNQDDGSRIIDLTIKDGLNYVLNLTSTSSKSTIIVNEGESYYIDYTNKTISKKKADEYINIEESVTSFLHRRVLDKRGHDILDGKLYYVEIYYNIGRTEFDNDAFYFRKGKLEFIKSSYFGNCYVESISNDIDESKFEIPEETKNFKVEAYEE